MLLVAIDGACRRNGKPSCISASSAFIMNYNEYLQLEETTILSGYEKGSTNQRGELIALLLALDYVCNSKQDARIITDSEYIFNAMTKNWFNTWENNNWTTATGTPVKNQDLWLLVKDLYDKYYENDIDVVFYHIKGHTMHFNKKLAKQSIIADVSGRRLYDAVSQKYLEDKEVKDIFNKTAEVSKKNNGFAFKGSSLERCVVSNMVADSIAAVVVEAIDA